MRNKKLLSTVVASALAATTIAMPVMAADGGSVDVEFTTKVPVIRVVAPTSILAAVDPLEMNTAGSQIHSSDFTLENKSEVAVGIDVKSVVTLGTGVTLVDTKAGATDSKGTDAWLAVAAETSDNKYTETTGKTAGDLTEADKNVTTFKTDATESSASQTFYLNKATSSTTTYKLATPVATGGKTAAKYNEELNYAQVYELTAQTYADEDALLAVLKTTDVYEGAATATDGETLTLIPAGTTSYTTFDKDTHTYYTAATDNKLGSMADGTKYVYGEGGAGEDTAFRYIGKLGQGKTSWSDTDIDEMTITYSIYGLTDEKFTAANKLDALYLSGPQVSLSTGGVVTISNLTEDANYAHSAILTYNGNDYELDKDKNLTWGTENWDATNGGTLIFTMNQSWLSALTGNQASVTVKLTNGMTVTTTQQF